ERGGEVELHQVPGGPRRPRGGAVRPADAPRGDRGQDCVAAEDDRLSPLARRVDGGRAACPVEAIHGGRRRKLPRGRRPERVPVQRWRALLRPGMDALDQPAAPTTTPPAL